MKKLAVIARLAFNLQQANLIQTLQMAEAFSKNIDTYVYSDKSRSDFILSKRKVNDKLKEYGTNHIINFKNFLNPFNYIPKSEPLREIFLALRVILQGKKDRIDFMFTRYERILYIVHKFFPTIFELHDINYITNLKYFLKILNEDKIKVVVISRNIKYALVKAGAKNNNIFIAHDAVNIGKFDSPNIELLFKSEREVVGYAGHLYDDRGIDLIIKIAKKYKQLDFEIAGGFAEDVEKYKRIAIENDVNNIHFWGLLPFNVIPSFLKSCDYLIMPYSRSLKTFNSCSPLKAFEYMAAGKVIICSKVPSIMEVLNDENALLFEPDNFDELDKIFDDIVNKRIDKVSLSNTVKEVIKEYTWERRAKLIISIFKQLEEN